MIRKIIMLGLLSAAVALVGCTTPNGGGNGGTKKKTKTKLDPIDSKIFQGASYDADGQVLTLQFNKGGTYRYAEVPKDVYDKFLASEDKGEFFLGEIKDKYVGKYVFDD